MRAFRYLFPRSIPGRFAGTLHIAQILVALMKMGNMAQTIPWSMGAASHEDTQSGVLEGGLGDQRFREKRSLNAVIANRHCCHCHMLSLSFSIVNFLCQICRDSSNPTNLGCSHMDGDHGPHHPVPRAATPTLKHRKVPPTQLLSLLKPPNHQQSFLKSLPTH